MEHKYSYIIDAGVEKSGDAGQCDCSDCDCACASSVSAFSGINYCLNGVDLSFLSCVPGSKLKQLTADKYMIIGRGHYPVILTEASKNLWVDFLNGGLYSQSIPESREICDAIVTMLKIGILVDSRFSNTEIYQKQLSAWLHLSDCCNLRCSYCYLPHIQEDMSLETGHASIDATFRSAIANGFKRIKLKYAGGEPLLRFPLISEMHRYANSLAEKNGYQLDGVVLSNGTLLTGEIVEVLKSLNLRLMISLDGLGQYHDSHRPYADGHGSFTDVIKAVDLALTRGLKPTISVTVSSRTVEGLPALIYWILERNLPFGLNFYRENGLSISYEDMRLDEQKIINGMRAAFMVIENNLPHYSILGGLVDRANLAISHTRTCGVGQSYLVFDQNGQVAKCQMHICQPITDVHIADPLAVIRADQLGLQNISVEEKEGCNNCEWKNWCAGGCPLETYRTTGRYDTKSPNCNIYKALLPDALRLEGLRLLKYQDDPKSVRVL